MTRRIEHLWGGDPSLYAICGCPQDPNRRVNSRFCADHREEDLHLQAIADAWAKKKRLEALRDCVSDRCFDRAVVDGIWCRNHRPLRLGQERSGSRDG